MRFLLWMGCFQYTSFIFGSCPRTSSLRPCMSWLLASTTSCLSLRRLGRCCMTVASIQARFSPNITTRATPHQRNTLGYVNFVPVPSLFATEAENSVPSQTSAESSCLIMCPADQICDPSENACCRECFLPLDPSHGADGFGSSCTNRRLNASAVIPHYLLYNLSLITP